MIRFSPVMVGHLDKALAANDTALPRVTACISKNLISSNVFLRSLRVSVAHCPEIGTRPQTSGIATLVLDKEKQLRLLTDLTMVLTMLELQQESLCCVSTLLCFFIFAMRAGELPILLERISLSQCLEQSVSNGDSSEGAEADEGEDEVGGDVKNRKSYTGAEVLANARSLLLFWQTYYTSERRQKDLAKDALTLETNSKIPVKEWLSVVETLLAPPVGSDVPPNQTLQFWEDKARGQE